MREAHLVQRRPARVSVATLIMALVLQALNTMGSLQEHLALLSGACVSAAALSQRRERLPLSLFERLLQVALRPRANPQDHPQAFYCGWRLVGLDGTEFSAANYPQIVSALGKAASRRFHAAFAKISVCLLMELGAHNPLAAAIGERGQKEYRLAQRLLEQLPSGALLLADRAYGVGAFLSELRAHWPEEQGHFLVRARANLAPKHLRTLADGSALVALSVRRAWGTPDAARQIVVREIRARVRRPGCPWQSVRLFTSLLDAQAHPAGVLVELYARRWEHELAYQELKIELRSTPLLRAHTSESAAQEIAALVLAQGLLAEARLQAAAATPGGPVEPLSISFAKVRAGVEKIVTVAAVAELAHQPIDQEQLAALWQAWVDFILWTKQPKKRRPRTCPRAVRQPVKSWPRLLRTESFSGKIQIDLLPTAKRPHRTAPQISSAARSHVIDPPIS